MARPRSVPLTLISLLVLITLFASACGSETVATLVPTLTFTPTPLSSPLPTISATQAVYGSADHPYRLLLLPPPESDTPAEPLAAFLNAQSGYPFAVEIVSSGAEALAALCSAVPTLARVDGLTLLAAQVGGCAQPLLVEAHGSGARRTTGIRSDLIVSPDVGIFSIGDLTNRVFCRLGADDLTTWIIPAMMMRNGGLDPLARLERVRNVPDLQSIVREVGSAQCAGAIPADTLGQYEDRIPGLLVSQAVFRLQTSPEVPYGGFVASTFVPEAVIESVVALLPANLEQLEGLLSEGSTALVAPVPEALAEAGQLMRGTGFGVARP